MLAIPLRDPTLDKPCGLSRASWLLNYIILPCLLYQGMARSIRSASQDRFLRVESILQRSWFTDALSP